MSFGIPVRNGLGIGLTSSTSISSGVRGTRPAMFLDFLNTTSLSGMVTFTRGSNATLVDSTGKITYAPANLLLQSQTFDNASWNKVRTTITANSTVAPDDTSTADKLVEDTTASSTHFTSQSANYTAGTTYTLSVSVKAAERSWFDIQLPAALMGTIRNAFFDVSNGTVGTVTSGVTAAIVSTGNGWYRCSVTFTPTASVGTSFAFLLANADNSISYTGDGTSGIFIWGAQLEPVTYQTTPSTYVATTTAAYYGPRFDYDPVTLAAKGLLIEEQRVNLLLQSQTFDAANWSKSGSTVTANATTSPDGTVDADKLVEAATTGQHRTSQAVTVTSGAAYTYSIYAKAAERTSIWVRIIGASTFAGGIVDLTNGAIIGITGTCTATNVGNGWYRITVSGTSDSTTATVYANLIDGAGANTYTGDGTSGLFIYGAQIEAGAFATSYIPTVASTVTRSADVATMTGTNFSSWYNQTEGTFVTSVQAVSGRLLSANDGSTANRILVFNRVSETSIGANIIVATVTQASLSRTVADTSAVNSVSLAYKENDFAFCANGGVVQTDGTGTVPTVSQLDIGREFTIAGTGHIRQIAYYNTRLPDATLQTLTEIPGAYSASYLAVAGGASGGSNDTNMGTGGGGAGGLLSGTSTLAAGTVYTVAVGAGGAVQSGNGNGLNGSNSSALGVTATGGGAGSGLNGGNGVAGGSGGGGSGSFGFATTSGGAGTSGQGFAGGNGQDSSVDADAQVGGGGGGASAVGSAGAGTSGGNGGAGTASSITGASVTYAGGGGGGKRIAGTAGTGGAGGGGNGGAAANGSAGTANRGGGGGGAGTGGGGVVRTGGAGGSGVVILSVPTAKYTGTTTGSPTVTTSGANTIMTFTSSGSYTA